MGTTYDIGDLVRVEGTFTNLAGAAADPSQVTLAYETPTSTAGLSYTRAGATTGDVNGIVRTGTGVYYFDILSTGVGLYSYRWTSTGDVQASGESWFSVRPRYVTT